MNDKLVNELLEDTTFEDIPNKYKPIVSIVGVKHFAELSSYARGNELYFPKVENIVSPARNRRIRQEYNYNNIKELAGKYNLTIQQIAKIIKDIPCQGQISMFDDYEN